MLICEVCNINEAFGCACVPGMPVSAAYCIDCLRANAHPWGALVSMVAIGGGNLDNFVPEIQAMVHATCKHLDRTEEAFMADVRESMKLIAEDESRNLPRLGSI